MYTKQHQLLQLDGISNKYVFVMFFWADGFVPKSIVDAWVLV